MKFLNLNKKGELSTQQIVLIIILIASFVVLLLFLLLFDFGENVEEQLCKDSISRTTLPGGSYKSLECNTQYVCLTRQGGKCDGLTHVSKKVKVNSMEEIYEFLAEDMASCWWMFGEGKSDYIGKEFLSSNYCSVCSQIYFDPSLKKIKEGDEEAINLIKEGKISKNFLYEYMNRNPYSQEQTYIEYLRLTDPDSILSTSQEKNGVGTFGSIDFNEGKKSLVVMGITTNVGEWEWVLAGVGTGGVIAAGLFAISLCPVSGGVGCIVGGAILGGALGAGGAILADSDNPAEIGALMVKGEGISNIFMAPTILEANSAKFAALNCEEIVTKY